MLNPKRNVSLYFYYKERLLKKILKQKKKNQKKISTAQRKISSVLFLAITERDYRNDVVAEAVLKDWISKFITNDIELIYERILSSCITKDCCWQKMSTVEKNQQKRKSNRSRNNFFVMLSLFQPQREICSVQCLYEKIFYRTCARRMDNHGSSKYRLANWKNLPIIAEKKHQ